MSKEQALIKKIRENGAQKLGPIYIKYREEFIVWAVKTYKCSQDEAKDIYQISVLTFYENIISDRLNTLTSTVKTYIFSIGRNKLMEAYRFSNRLTGLSQDNNIAPEADQDKLLTERQLETMENCLSKIGDPCQQILKLYYYNRNSMEDISIKLGYKNADSVKNQKYKCLQRLRKLIKDQGRTDI